MGLKPSDVAYFYVYIALYNREYYHYYDGTGRNHKVVAKKFSTDLYIMTRDEYQEHVDWCKKNFYKVEVEVTPL